MIGKRDPFLGISRGLSTDDVVVLNLRGVLDDGSCHTLTGYVDDLASRGVHRVILNMKALYLVDDAGCRALAALEARLRSVAGSLKLTHLSHHVRAAIDARRWTLPDPIGGRGDVNPR